MNNLNQIISHFSITGTVADVKPLGNGLINDTYKITTAEADAPDYVLQRINDSIFTDVDLLQHNIEEVTTHIRELLVKEGADDKRPTGQIHKVRKTKSLSWASR